MKKTVYQLRGEIDLATVPEVAQEIKALLVLNGHCDLVIDCSFLEFIDSSGIALLVDLQQNLENRGRHLRMIRVPAFARRALEVCGLGSMLVG